MRKLLKPWAITAAIAAWSLVFAACMSSTNRTVSATAQVAGAKAVGGKECASCHSEVVAKFQSSTHAKLGSLDTASTAVGCEACHGGASAHVKAGGGVGTILNPKNTPETCYTCHLDKRGQFSLPNSHPVKAGKVTCSDCHDPHDGSAIKGKGAATLEKENETCTKCHVAQKGPFVFKHNALKEGCVACHNPHGSVNQKMLVARDANLCVKCHLERPGATAATSAAGALVAGGEDHRSRLQNGTCWVAGCHEAVHGSNTSKALRY